MAFEIDHVFVFVSAGGPEADQFAALGLREGAPNRHPGQGTACRRFFFANAYLELLWVEDPAEAQGEFGQAFRIWERWSGRTSGASPFGVILRPGHGEGAPPFPHREYRPPYFPPFLTLAVGDNSSIPEEPLLCALLGSRPEEGSQGRRPPEHPAGFLELTGVRIFSPRATGPSAAMRPAQGTAAFTYASGDEHLLEVGFDGESKGRRADLRPALPLVVCW